MATTRSVQQGDGRRKAAAAHAEATWRCNAYADDRRRESCLAQRDVASPAFAPPPVRTGAKAVAVVVQTQADIR